MIYSNNQWFIYFFYLEEEEEEGFSPILDNSTIQIFESFQVKKECDIFNIKQY